MDTHVRNEKNEASARHRRRAPRGDVYRNPAEGPRLQDVDRGTTSLVIVLKYYLSYSTCLNKILTSY